MLLGALSEGQAKWDLETSAGLTVSWTGSLMSTSKLTSNIVPISMCSCCTRLSQSVLWSASYKPTQQNSWRGSLVSVRHSTSWTAWEGSLNTVRKSLIMPRE